MSTVDTTSYYESLTSSSSDSTTTTTDEASLNLTAEEFLTLLVAELEYQDPTEPVDNTEMVNQLTQYSQLDELTAMNEKLDTLTDSLDAITATNGLDYLGKDVEASGSTITVEGDDISTLYFELDEDAATLSCNIYDSSGNIIDTLEYTDVDSGTHTFSWDGTDSDGETVDDGEYTIVIGATDSDGDDVDVSTTTTGTVTGISNTDDGIILTLEDGRTVNMLDVTYVNE